MWKEVEDRKVDETGLEEAGRKRRKRRKKKTSNRGGENDRKNYEREGR